MSLPVNKSTDRPSVEFSSSVFAGRSCKRPLSANTAATPFSQTPSHEHDPLGG